MSTCMRVVGRGHLQKRKTNALIPQLAQQVIQVVYIWHTKLKY